MVTAVTTEDGVECKAELGKLTDERKQQICKAIEDGKNYGYVMTGEGYFFVDKFFETDFKKIAPVAPMGTRVFDLTQVMIVGFLEKQE